MALPFFQQGAFQNSANMTPDQIERKRAYIAAMMPRFGSAKYVGEGLGQLATGFAVGRQNKKLDGAEEAGMSMAEKMFSRLFGTANSAQSSDMGPLSVLGSNEPWTPGPEAPKGPDPTKTHMGMPDVASGGLAFPGQEKVVPDGTEGGFSFGPDVGQGPTTADAIFRETLLAGGLPEHAVEGIMMNAHDESAFNPNAVGDNGAAFGLLQWNGPRKRALEKFAAETGGNPADPAVQAKFTIYELQGPESAAGQALLAAKTPGEAGAAFVNLYERPAESHRARREAAYLGGGGRTSGGGQAYSAPTGDYGGSQGGGIPMAELQLAMANPWIMSNPAMAGVIQAEFARQQAQNDPMYQLQLQQAQLELDKARNPPAPEPIEVGGVLLDPVTMQPIYDSREPPKPTSDIQNYEYYKDQEIAAGRVPLSIAEWSVMDEKATVPPGAPTIGTIPPGYEAIQDPKTKAWTMRPIPGGPEDKSVKDNLRKQNAVAATETASTAAKRALEAASRRAVDGVFGAIAAYNPESVNAEVYRQTDALKAMASIESLTAMRNASPTGAGMGNPTDRDAVLLEQKHGALDPKSPNYSRDLLDYTRALFQTIHGKDAGDALFDEQFADQIAEVSSGKPNAAAAPSTPDADGWITTKNGVKVRVKQ
jgi:Phage tail lysozyme